MDILDIKDSKFLKDLKHRQLVSLAQDIRLFLIDKISKTGGHLSSNLGVVELTMALHIVFDLEKDKLIFDVGHQSYVHKILTGRSKEFDQLRQYQGLSGFINSKESKYDTWESGHSSTSLSAQCGYLLADNTSRVAVLIGDASIANGVAFEALNYMSTLKNVAPIIILNDNKMSINKSVGAVSRTFSRLRSSRIYRGINNILVKILPGFMKSFLHRVKTSIKGLILKENLFESLGYDYIGPYNGNDIDVCIKALKTAKKLNKPCVVHFVTKKGKGFKFAEEDDNGTFHAITPFDIHTGIVQAKCHKNKTLFSNLTSNIIADFIDQKDYFVITPAMIKGSGLELLQKQYPHRVLDVGIQEEHATVMASAIAQQNKKVILMLYSTFSQRAYDYFLNDIARVNAKVIISLDRADIVPNDGSTHQGIYDIAMFSSMPNIQIIAPRNGNELLASFNYADKISSPIVIRYPKTCVDNITLKEEINSPTWKIEKEGTDIILITYGESVDYCLDAIKDLPISVKLVNARFIKPFDQEMLNSIIQSNKPVLVYENCVINGGLSSIISLYMIQNNARNNIVFMGFDKDDIIVHGSREDIRRHFHLAKDDIKENIMKMLKIK